MTESLLFDSEYSIIGQIEITSPISYIMILLFVISISLLILSWYNFLKLKTIKFFKLSNIINLLVLILCLVLIYIHSILQLNIIKHEAIVMLPNQVSSDLVLRGFYISKIIPRFALIIGIIVFFSMIPTFINSKNQKIKSDSV